MPGRSGWQFLQDVAASERLTGTPIVIVTSQALSSEARALLEQSTKGILMKNDLTEETVRRAVDDFVANTADRTAQARGGG
jgi:CheY-like chemotaxis protein